MSIYNAGGSCTFTVTQPNGIIHTQTKYIASWESEGGVVLSEPLPELDEIMKSLKAIEEDTR